jgi:hypothetical protein
MAAAFIGRDAATCIIFAQAEEELCNESSAS